jgi:hypothetical protein
VAPYTPYQIANEKKYPQAAKTMDRVYQIKPDYKDTDYAEARAKAVAEGRAPVQEEVAFVNKEGKTIRSFGVLAGHLNVMRTAMDALNNPSDVRLVNYFRNLWKTEFKGDPEPKTFEAVRGVVLRELLKAIQGGATALGDRTEVIQELDSSSSMRQLRDIVDKYTHLAGEQLGGLRKQYEYVSRGKKNFDTMLTEAGKKTFEKQDDPFGWHQ